MKFKAIGCALAFLLIVGMRPAAAMDCATTQEAAEIEACAAAEFKKSEAELSRIYTLAAASIVVRDNAALTPEQRQQWKQSLSKSQDAWTAFRDSDCNELTDWEWFGGVSMNAENWACLAAKSQARSEELKDRYSVQ